jgi:hypothetical protein
MADLVVAETILAQLGGARFKMMTGAKNFVGGSDSLSFSIPKAKKGINKVRIVLKANDLYQVTFFKLGRSLIVNTIAIKEDIYADQLQEIFTNETGLYTRL